MSRSLRRDSSYLRQTFLPDPENVPSRVHVPIMGRSAVRTFPAPYSQTCDTFRATEATALRAGYGSVSFVGLDVYGPVPSGFVAELCTQRRPARIRDGLRHLRSLELSGADIADNDQRIFSGDFGRPLMQMVTPRVRDLGMDRARTTLVVRALSHSQRRLVLPIVLQGGNSRAVAACRERLEAEVDADRSIANRPILRNFALKCRVPAAAGILYEGARPNLTFDRTREPKPILTTQISYFVAANSHRSRDERYPPKSAARTAACPEAGMISHGIARMNEPATRGIHCVGVQPKYCRTSSAQPDQIEFARKARRNASFPLSLSLTLDIAAIIPHLIHRTGVSCQRPGCPSIFDAVSVRKNHRRKSRIQANQKQQIRIEICT